MQIVEEPRVDAGQLVNLGDAHAALERVAQIPHPLGPGLRQLARRSPSSLGCSSVPHRSSRSQPKPSLPHFQPAQRLLERLLERAADGHRLADALHLRRERGVGLGEFLERKPRNLRHHVVDRRLEAGRRLARDVVRQLVQPIADGQLGRDLRDRKAGRLRRQRARAAHARIHLDDDHPPRPRMDRELNVRAARLDADLADHRQRGVAHPLIFLVGQRLRGRDGDRVARVNAHRVEILDRADDHDVVVLVAHHLHLVLFPADDRFLDEHLVDGRLVEAAAHQLVELAVGCRRSPSRCRPS